MAVIHEEYRKGVRLPSPVVSCTVAATSVSLYNPNVNSDGQTCCIRKISVKNNQVGQVVITIGTGVSPTVAGIPPFTVPGGQDTQIPEDLIPNTEFGGQITVMSSAAGVSPNDVQVQVEVEQYSGATAHA